MGMILLFQCLVTELLRAPHIHGDDSKTKIKRVVIRFVLPIYMGMILDYLAGTHRSRSAPHIHTWG